MLILIERYYEDPELLSQPGEIREGFQEEMIAELSAEGIVAVRCTRGGRSNMSQGYSHVNLRVCVCLCVCVFKGAGLQAIHLCMHLMKSFTKHFLRFAVHRQTTYRV